jgi:large subunit ribosomal protein L25
MAESTVLTVFPRTVIGKANRRLGTEGRIPAVLYGMSREALSLEVTRHDFEQFMSHHSTSSTVVEIQIAGEKKPVHAMIRELQVGPIKGQIMHIDFMAVSLDALVSAVVSVRLTGDPAGVKEGGILTVDRHEVNVEAKPGDLPEFIELDVAALEIGDSVHVRDITPPKGVTITDDVDAIVASVTPPAAEEEVEEVAVAEEPELIGAKPEE